MHNAAGTRLLYTILRSSLTTTQVAGHALFVFVGHEVPLDVIYCETCLPADGHRRHVIADQSSITFDGTYTTGYAEIAAHCGIDLPEDIWTEAVHQARRAGDFHTGLRLLACLEDR